MNGAGVLAVAANQDQSGGQFLEWLNLPHLRSLMDDDRDDDDKRAVMVLYE